MVERFIKLCLMSAILCGACGCSLSSGGTEDTAAKEAGRAHAAAAVGVAMAEVSLGGGNDAKPDEPVSDECQSCYGKGRSGDGLSVCQACGGTGKRKKTAEPVAEVATVESPWSQLPPGVAEQLSSAVEQKLAPRFRSLDESIVKALSSQQCVMPATKVGEVKTLGRPDRFIQVYMMKKENGVCIPCDDWKRNHRESIVADGWTLDEQDALPNMRVPTFRVWVGNNYKDHIGVLSLTILHQYQAELLR